LKSQEVCSFNERHKEGDAIFVPRFNEWSSCCSRLFGVLLLLLDLFISKTLIEEVFIVESELLFVPLGLLILIDNVL
jgi:hypothetical protein